MLIIVSDYILIFYYFIISLFLSIILFILPFFYSFFKKDLEKLESYECGFSPFEDSRQEFEVRFYLISILFLIFDLEIMYLLPWSLIFFYLDITALIIMYFFFFLIILGLIYEWINGALNF